MAGFFSRGGRAHTRPESGDAADGLPDAEGRGRLLDELEDAGLGLFWASDGEGKLTYVSQVALDGTGILIGDVVGRNLTELFIADTIAHSDEDQRRRPLPFLLSSHTAINDYPVRLDVADRDVWWAISARAQLDHSGNFTGYRGTLRDISCTREEAHDAARKANYDELTGLANRHRMNTRLEATLQTFTVAKRSCALMLLDLDRFKQVNDTLGHPAGDELLRQVAQRLQRILGDNCEIGRMGGDEFQVILPDIDDRGALADKAKQLIQMISQPYSLDGRRAIIGTSIGVAIAPYDGLSVEELVGSADLALYAAKTSGRGQYRFYSHDLRDNAKNQREIEEDLRDAVAAEQLHLAYQALIDSDSEEVACFEALLRWDHPERGGISPSVFVPVAEEAGLIDTLGLFALRQACKDAAGWPESVRVAVNVSVPQFMSDDFVDRVRAALTESGLCPGRLTLEITENIFMADPDAVTHSIRQLKKLGVQLALDDFGTGYSSFGYLQHAPFDKIKIDQSFVRGSTVGDTNNAKIVRAIVGLADALDIATVAEGVETLDELALMRDCGATLIQGFVYAQPERAEIIVERLASGDLKYAPSGPRTHRAERRSLFRKVGIIHGDHRYHAVLRNLSRSGARIEGLAGVSVGTPLVLDLGEGQLAVGEVRRAGDIWFGMEFETPLISDGADGLCTRYRISPYALAAAGMPLGSLPKGDYPLSPAARGSEAGPRQFMEVDSVAA